MCNSEDSSRNGTGLGLVTISKTEQISVGASSQAGSRGSCSSVDSSALAGSARFPKVLAMMFELKDLFGFI